MLKGQYSGLINEMAFNTSANDTKLRERGIDMKKYKWNEWGKAAGIRAVKTAAQTAVGLIGTSVAISDVSWQVVVSASLLAGVVSLLTSIAGLPELNTPIE